ncbi:DUF2232 domain-containing protein [Virgibacillus soli]|uniref:DUF2232 domain-containing protein n=1 Tax=Paracerasibacillus soli TaxID=480284 RepID=A0ABU5CU77_9BACI|nr:DUF2232 domain-containing protein [Virgibacillus soli]MDY0409914.1 DUF2232 domain-containing protein [Virgibacillus soli]
MGTGTAGFVVGFLFAYLFAVLVFDVNIMNQVDQFVNTANEQSKALLHQFGVSNIDQQIEIIEEQMMIMKHLIPMMLVAISIFFAFIVQWISYKLLNRIEKANYHFPPFRTLSFPTAIVWVYFVALLVSFFQTDKEGVLFLGAQNIMILAGLLMAIQGLSFVFFYCYEKKVSKAIPIVVVILTLIFSPLLLPFIRILGIIDIGFGLRNRITKK